MKTSKIILSSFVISGMLLFATSCSKDFYAKKNNNPNAPNSVLPNVQLTPIEVSIAYAQGGDMSRFASMFVQQTAGLSRQSAAYFQYVFTNQDPETVWDNMYTAAMFNDYNLMQQCIASNGKYNAYKGMTEVLMAYSLQISVDCWGDMPYSQAFQGQSNLQPAYDKAATIYSKAMSLCYQGIADLNNTTNDVLSPGSDDVIYAGNTASWVKFAHAILARLFVHQSYTGSGSIPMADSALAHVSQSFASNADNAQVFFGAASTANAPWNQFWNQRGDIYFFFGGAPNGQSYFYNLEDSLNDPRRGILIDTLYEFTPPYSLLSYYQLPNSPVEFICYDEMQFVAAEATLTSTGNLATAQTFYQNAITANMQKLSNGIAALSATNGFTAGSISPTQIATYLASYGTLPVTVNDAKAAVDFQEYIALYLNPEAWVLWRRSTKIPGYPSGSPRLTPIAGPFQSNGIPRRFLYPQSELNLNASNVPSASEWSPKIFWDN